MELTRTDLRPAAEIDDDELDALCTIITETYQECVGGTWYTRFATTATGEGGYAEGDDFTVERRYAKNAIAETRAFRQHWEMVQNAVRDFSNAEFPLRQITYYEIPAEDMAYVR